MPRVVIYQPRPVFEECGRMLEGKGFELVVCSDREALFDALTERRPDCLVYVLDDLMLDLGLLAVLRRVAPRLPFIVLGGASGLEARRSVQDLKPTYYGMFPLDPSELSDAVAGAVRPHHA